MKTTRRADAAPLFSDCFTLCEWLFGRLGQDAHVLPRAVCRNALELFDHALLALKNVDRTLHIEEADIQLMLLRNHLRLACAIGCLTQEQMMHALDIADRIGRQLGGWQRTLDAA